MSAEQRSTVLRSQKPDFFLALCPGCRGERFPLQLTAGNLLLIFLMLKQPHHKPPPGCSWMQRASSVQVGDSSSTLEREGTSLVQPTLCNLSRTYLLPTSLCSACFGDIIELHQQQVSQPDGGQRAPEHSAAPETSKGNPKCCRKWCS